MCTFCVILVYQREDRLLILKKCRFFLYFYYLIVRIKIQYVKEIPFIRKLIFAKYILTDLGWVINNDFREGVEILAENKEVERKSHKT